jgi:hypothetical protein
MPQQPELSTEEKDSINRETRRADIWLRQNQTGCLREDPFRPYSGLKILHPPRCIEVFTEYALRIFRPKANALVARARDDRTLETWLSAEVDSVCGTIENLWRKLQYDLRVEFEVAVLPDVRTRLRNSRDDFLQRFLDEEVSIGRPPVGGPNRPQICFDKWGPIPNDHPLAMPLPHSFQEKVEFLQAGFYLSNDGGAAHDITVESFEVEPSVRANGETLARIGEKGTGFALVWVEGYSPLMGSVGKWDLLGAMARASDNKDGNPTYRPDYGVTVSVIYRDADNAWFRSWAKLTHIWSQGRLKFGPTTQERVDPMLPPHPSEAAEHMGAAVNDSAYQEASGDVSSGDRKSGKDQPFDHARVARETRARTVAQLIKELDDLKPQMFEDEAEYNSLKAHYPKFLVFKVAETRPDLKMKVLSIRASTRHIRLAQELAAAHHRRQVSTIQTDWKNHKPAEFRHPR